MKTFFEYFLDEVVRKQEAGEIDAEKAQRWVAELQGQLQAYAQDNPMAPIAQMPVRHCPQAEARLGRWGVWSLFLLALRF